MVKITDFGLSKDKKVDASKRTVMMTGCGSTLWMAPEMIEGTTAYNEAVDVFSYLGTLPCLSTTSTGAFPYNP